MALRDKQVDSYYRTVRTIASSSYVHTFHIGYTSRAGIARFKDYKPFEFEHLVILADKLTEDDAKGLEEKLQQKCREDKREVTWRKYHPHKRMLRYYPGSKSPTPKKENHSVYMVWWEPEDE